MEMSERRDDAAAVVESLRRLVQGLRASAYVAERDLGISGAQLFVLRELAGEPGASIRRLSERTLTDPSSVSVVVARLVERGLVIRGRDPKDGRKSTLSVSKRGRSLLARAPEPYQARLIEALRGLPTSRVRQLGRTLSEVVGLLGQARGGAPLFFEERADAPDRAKGRRRARG